MLTRLVGTEILGMMGSSMPLRFWNKFQLESDVKRWNIRMPKWQKKLLFNKDTRPFPGYSPDVLDVLSFPGLNKNRLILLQNQILASQEVNLSSDNVSLLLYNLSKNDMCLPETWDLIEPNITKHRGQYNTRAAFGGIYGCLLLNKQEAFNFFMKEKESNQYTFCLTEAIEIVEALNRTKLISQIEDKHQYWDEHFRTWMIKEMKGWRLVRKEMILRLFDALYKFELKDSQVWKIVVGMMAGKKGWDRIDYLPRLLLVRQYAPQAQELYRKYLSDMKKLDDYRWRYNFELYRLYTSEEMIAKSQDGIRMIPSERTLLGKKAKSLNTQYERWLKEGAVEVEAEVIKDKSQSLAYAIKDRYFNLKTDNVDFSKMTKAEFEDLFGDYDEELIKEKADEDVEAQDEKDDTDRAVEAENARLAKLRELEKKQYKKKPRPRITKKFLKEMAARLLAGKSARPLKRKKAVKKAKTEKTEKTGRTGKTGKAVKKAKTGKTEKTPKTEEPKPQKQ